MRVLQALFLVMATAAFSLAAPPDVPRTLAAKPGELTTLTVKGKDVCYSKPFADTDVFFARLHTNDVGTLQFVVQVKPSRRVTTPLAVFFWTKGEDDGSWCVIDPNGTTNPTDPPGGDKPPPIAGVKFLTLVRGEGPSSPEWSAMLKLPQWKELESKGHQWKEYTLSEAAAANIKIPAGTALPCVLTWQALDSGIYKEIRGPTSAPKTGADILKLVE